MAAFAVGAGQRADRDVGDRLVWVGWLPFCSVLALAAFGLGAPVGAVLLIFLGTYNLGHLGLRAWGLQVGWRNGMRLAGALGHPVLRQGPAHIGRGAALLAGLALPLVLHRMMGPGHVFLGEAVGVALLAAALLARFHGRIEGWRVALAVLAALALYSVTRS
jgi:mannose PTS system EIID component